MGLLICVKHKQLHLPRPQDMDEWLYGASWVAGTIATLAAGSEVAARTFVGLPDFSSMARTLVTLIKVRIEQ